MARTTFSIVVPSRNRSPRVAGFLEALGRIDYPHEDWELIFVDNGSTDDTKDAFRDAIATLPIRSTYVEEPHPGINRARNRGVQCSRYEIVVFTDDDCYPRADLLRAYHDEYAAGDVGFIGGRVSLPEHAGTRLSLQEQPTSEEIPPRSFLRAGLIHGANMSIRRDVLERQGLFDPRFGTGGDFLSAADVELLARLSFAGVAGRYSPRPVVWHDRGWMSPEAIAHVRRHYDIGRGAYYMRMVMEPSARLTYLKHWCGRALLRVSDGHPDSVLRELQGALAFLRHPLTGRRVATPAGDGSKCRSTEP